MKKPKKEPTKRNPMAKALASPLFAKRVVPLATKYRRPTAKRELRQAQD